MKSVPETTPDIERPSASQETEAAPQGKTPISAKISKYAAYDNLQG